jgi:hypothetical protein
MVYEMDERELLRFGRSPCCFGEIRAAKDPTIQAELLTRAQIVLTDFVFGLSRRPTLANNGCWQHPLRAAGIYREWLIATRSAADRISTCGDTAQFFACFSFRSAQYYVMY